MNLMTRFDNKNFVKTFFLLAILIVSGVHQISAIQFAITQKAGSGGRLGDEIQMYATAKWFAYKYNIPFYATPFRDSEALALAKVDQELSLAFKSTFDQIVTITNESELIGYLRTSNVATLFEVDARAHAHFSSQLVLNSSWPDGYLNMYAHSRENPAFCSELKKVLMPTNRINTISLPKDRISVAVHVRKGSGDDAGLMSVQYLDEWEYITSHGVYNFNYFSGIDRFNPFRFPPEQFYVDQLLKLSALFNHCPLYVYIFTDDKDPNQLVQRLRRRVPLSNIILSCRQNAQNAADNKNCVMQDLYDMAQFDCLIKPESGFSAAAQLIGNHKIIIYPQAIRWFTVSNIRQSMLFIDATAGIFYNPRTDSVEYVHFDEITAGYKEQAARLFN